MKTGTAEANISKDQVWVWDGPADSLGPSIYGLGDTTKILDLDNIMCMWMTSTTQDHLILNRLKHCKKIGWEITTFKWMRREFKWGGKDKEESADEHIGWFKQDSWTAGRKWETVEEARKISKLSRTYPNLAGGILDFSFDGFAQKGGTPADLEEIYRALKKDNDSMQLYWMFYTPELDPKWAEFLPYIDVLGLWEPDSNNLKNLEASVDKCAQVFPGKPILLGLYLVNYWAKHLEPDEDHPLKWHATWAMEPIPIDLQEHQFTTAVRLVKEGKIIGFQILAESLLDKLPETTEWVRKFLKDNVAK